jgi:hypothetical protein
MYAERTIEYQLILRTRQGPADLDLFVGRVIMRKRVVRVCILVENDSMRYGKFQFPSYSDM